MCGIVGCLGREDAQQVIVKGLKTLEYRGYDSAGVAIHNGEFINRSRARGKLVNLENKLLEEPIPGSLGIGHTRWATHGPATEKNAHPHMIGGVSVVHNGIIENYAELRDELKTGGAEIYSDTDTELIAHLINNKVKETGNLLSAVKEVIPRLKGAYAVLALSERHPDEMVAFTNGPPLLVGFAEKSFIVASDMLAIVPYTKKIAYLSENEIVHIQKENHSFYSSDLKIIDKKIEEINWSAENVEKSGYPYFMLKEIFEQPRSMAKSLEPYVNVEKQSINIPALEKYSSEIKNLEQIYIVSCGTSFYSGMVGEYLLEKMSGVSCKVDIASEFRYRSPQLMKNALLIVISQSGETADTLAALRLAKEQGVRTLSLCNVQHSSMDRESDIQLYMNAGVEIGVASTKAFICSLSILNLLAGYIAKVKERMTTVEEGSLVQSLLATPSHMESVLTYDKFFAEAADRLKSYKGFLYMGRGVNFPIALEGALKLKELAYMHAEGYAAGEMKHGPLALIDEEMAVVMIAPKDDLYDKTISNLETAKARGAQVISIGTVNDERLKNLSINFLSIPKVPWNISPFLSVIPLQLLSLHVASALGHDVDQPRNLAKSVTVE